MLPLLHSRGPRDSEVPEVPSLKERPSAECYYRPSGQGDLFLFSPSTCSLSSGGSSSSSSNSFDTLSYSYSPADIKTAPKLLSPPSRPVASTSGSPLFVEAYLTGTEPKFMTRLSPSTPFDELFNSSPGGYWQAGDLSVSPISRHSSAIPADVACEVDSEDEAEPPGKLQSLLEYARSQDITDTPRSYRASSPSSLSSLSSVPSSPSALFSGLPASSSQTSRGRTPSCSPARLATARAALGSPFTMLSKATADSLLRRSSRAMPVSRTTRRSLATEILNQLGRPRSDCPVPGGSSSLAKRSSSPLPALSESDDENYDPSVHRMTRKRARLLAQVPSTHRKKRRTSTMAPTPPASTSEPAAAHSEDQDDDEPPTYLNRTLPLRIPIHDNFPLFYRRFPVSSVIDVELAAAHKISVLRVPDALSNAPRDAFDLYTPRFVKGRGTTKVGLCPMCHEKTARGGDGKKLWLSMKFSAFNYHMQYAHGISPSTGRPFSPPIGFRTVSRANPGKHEKTQIMEGKCHKCKKWAPVEGIKDVPSKVKEIFWWKHAATCHQGSTIDGECDIFVEDDVFRAVVAAQEAGDEDAEGESVHEDDLE
ncbi:hypothetical protein K466DRAFT_554853 [Polyporus arcularius HHB13444]|uniref:Transcription regulator Rua1 C-terminal domain-containing protein n=1 Tax=Polyporus arcularius HHB13444 TaxID=1314778 RepID=A0A5C3P4Q5_9APHY|nr:hypothetical protein K466DRAFT_554853 [Polyporus arcularius HHB13444]